ncbi:Zn(2)-C6 fungal-type domain-containing protein [Fusarium sp. LHS14.1]|nr:Zn(2)-C6 fungal-type domain-containing protein [Fusarium sp. LHS14.1]
MIYLTIVVEGCDPSHPKVLHGVQRILEIINTIPWQVSLRSIMWPFCVAGCLAAPEQEDMFRSVVSAMGPFQAFGTAKEALGLMERVWGLRNQLDKDSWSLFHCFEVDGVNFLLI